MHRRSCSGWVPSPYSNFHFGAPFFHPLPHVHYAFQHGVCLSPFTWVVAPSIKRKPVNAGKEYTKSYCIGRILIALVYSPGFRILVPINISRGGRRTRFGEASIRFPRIVPHPIRVLFWKSPVARGRSRGRNLHSRLLVCLSVIIIRPDGPCSAGVLRLW